MKILNPTQGSSPELSFLFYYERLVDMFECNKCENEETEYCSSCVEVYCKPSNWKRKEFDTRELMKESEIDIDKIRR